MFSLLSGRAFGRAEHAAARREADLIGVPFSEKVLADSLRLFLSAPVLLEVDRGSRTGNSEHLSSVSAGQDSVGEEQLEDDWLSVRYGSSSSSSATCSATGSSATGANGAQVRYTAQELLEMFSGSKTFSGNRHSSTLLTQFTSFVEFLYADLMQAQMDFSAMPGECMNTTLQLALSFSAFEHWVARAPDVYASLLHLLLPLLPYGVALTSEEMDLASRGLSQRCGELRARGEVKAQGLQRRRFMKLHARYLRQMDDSLPM